MRIIRGGLFAIALSLPALSACAAAPAAGTPAERVYFIGQTASVDGYGTTTTRSFVGLSLDQHPDGGRSLRTRVLWGGQSGGGSTGNLLQLDPEDPEVSDYLDVLKSGFRLDLDAKGVVRGVAAVDQRAWKAVVADEPRLAQMAMPQEQILGMRPMVLPDRLRVGQVIVTRDDRSQFGPIEWRAEVLQLDDAHVLLDLVLTGEQIEGRARQLVARADGMPREAWLELDTDEREDGTPAVHQLLYMVDIALARDPLAMLEGDAHPSVDDYSADLLAAPPFSAPSGDAALFALEDAREGELEAWMPRGSLLEQLDRSAAFVAERESDAHRAQLRLGGQLAPRRRYDPERDAMPAWQMVRLRGVRLLDADGRPIPGLDAVPTVRDWTLVDTFGVEEAEAGFPFRLPLDATAAQLDALDRIAFDAQVEAYRWDGVEQVTAGAQPRDTDVQLDWGAPHRVTVVIADPADASAGLWASAVPYDAAGRQIPSTQMQHRRPQVAARDDGVPVLAWQRRSAPVRLELAAAAPIASVRLRRYRWEWQDRPLVFVNASGVGQGGPLVGSLRVEEPDTGAWPDTLQGEALLALIRPDGRGDRYRSLRLDAPSGVVGWATALCQVESAATGALKPQARIAVRERGPGYGGSWSLGDGPAERGSWSLELDEALLLADDLPATWPVLARCPASVQRIREPVAGSACFSAQGDGWLRIAPACRGRVLVGDEQVIGRDADGAALARLPADSRDHHVRFWGEVAQVEYVLGSEEQVRRLIALPQAD